MADLSSLARTIFGGLSGSYDRVVEVMTLRQDASWKERMVAGLSLRRGMDVLDVGCGTGLLEEMDALLGSRVTGIDLTQAMLRVAKGKSLPGMSGLVQGDADHLPFRDSSFDAAVSCYVPKYCDTLKLLEEMRRVLRRTGVMAIYDFTRPHGPLSPLLKLYIYGAVPALGRFVSAFDPKLAITFRELPGLIRSTRWHLVAEDAFSSGLLSKLGEQEMAAGVVTVFWATKL